MTAIKKHDSTYFVENEWVDEKGREQKATVRLEIDYSNKKCSIKPAISEKFLFVNGKLAEWIAVANCIRNAAEFAQIELGETEGKDTIDLSRVPEMCTNLIGEPIPDCKTETSTEIRYGFIIYPVPGYFEMNAEYPLYPTNLILNYNQVIDWFDSEIKNGHISECLISYIVFRGKPGRYELTNHPIMEDMIIAKYEI